MEGSRLKSYLEARRREVDRALAACLPSRDACPGRLLEAMEYSLMAGGKRLRPILAMAAAEACGAHRRVALTPGCAIEFVHTYSLVHDDLPAMDDDDLRRGRPTSHRVFGEAVAILAGDALLTEAFNILAARGRMPAGVRRRLIAELAAAAGPRGMAGGQVLDLEAEGTEADPGTVRAIHDRKTADLIAASVRMGALAAGAGRGLLARLTLYGRNLGRAFQAVDDILDEEGEAGRLGKTPGSDRRKGKATLPAAVGLEAARSEAAELGRLADTALAGLGGRTEVLRALTDYILTRRS